MKRILALSLVGWFLGWTAPVQVRAADDGPRLKVEVDRNDIPEDESLSLKFTFQTSSGNLFLGLDPQFDAPDFDVVNSYQSTQMQSVFDGGGLHIQNNVQITKVLRPRKTGDLKITHIRATVAGKPLTSPDVIVHVSAAGQGTPPRNLPPGSGTGVGGLRGGGRSAGGEPFFVRAEVPKNTVYKGEQLVVSYYLYRNAQLFNMQVTKYPILTGFLREDIDLPIVRGRMDWEPVISGGVQYQRALLARYAAYPLHEGELKIDQMSVKSNYYPTGGSAQGGGDDDDPFMQFFQQLQPRTKDAKSDFVSVTVVPLPVAGKPDSFTGAVGDFNVVAAVDKYQVRANEPVTLTVKVEGRGNVGAFEEPKAPWPDGVDLYESKGRAGSGAAGYAQKIFEFLLIPRQPGHARLPGLEFSFFDPQKKTYVTRSTQPVDLDVGEAAPGTVTPPPRPSQNPAANPLAQNSTPGAPATGADGADLRYLLPPGALGSGGWASARWGIWVLLLGVLSVAGVIWSGWMAGVRARTSGARQAGKQRQARQAEWASLDGRASGLGVAQVASFYEALESALLVTLTDVYGSRVRALPRSELGAYLTVEKGLSAQLWARVEKVLEFAESARFGAAGGEAAASQATRWAREGRQIAQELAGV